MNVNNKNNHSLKLTDYKVLSNNPKTQGFWDRWSEDNENAIVQQNKLINWSWKNWSIIQLLSTR